MLRHHWRRTNDLYPVWSVNCALLAKFDRDFAGGDHTAERSTGRC